jgi:hypothetical protein
VLADKFADVVFQGIAGIRIVWTVGNVAGILAETSIDSGHIDEVNSGDNALIRSGENFTEAGAGGQSPVAGIVQNDVVGRVAGYKFVEQRGRKRRRQARDHADSGPAELGLDSGEASCIGPERSFIERVPGVVDVAEADAFLLIEIVIDFK